MIVCPRCGKENQDHYKFCLGCGAELPRNAVASPKSFTAPTPPAGMPHGPLPTAARAPAMPPISADAATQVAAAPEAAMRAPAPAAHQSQSPLEALTCPKCAASVPKNFKFCGSCGHPMGQAGAGPIGGGASAAGINGGAAANLATPSVQPVASRGSLVVIRPDGSEGEAMSLGDITVVGRQLGGSFAADLYLSPRHATFTFEGNGLVVRDEDSLNGVYVRVERDVPTELVDGSVFRIGQELIRFNSFAPAAPAADGVEVMGSPDPGYIGRLSLVVGRATTGNAFPVPPQGLHLGRERGDLIFPEDGYVSGLHARVYTENGRVLLVDVGSSNGTFLRVHGKRNVKSGDLILMGQQLFRAEF